MPNSQTSDALEKESHLRHYLPDLLCRRWQAGDTAPALAHLRAVLRAVLTYLPRYVAQERLDDPGTPAVSGRFAQATLMFADISGFTAMSERLTQLGREGAEVITGIVNDYFAAMLDIIARYGGDLYKFGGDALLVSFFIGEEGAVRACQAALEMQEAMARFAVVETQQGTFNLRMKVGLGTGTLFWASLGSPERLEYAVMGPALGQMARAESLAEAREVLLDRATREAAGEGVDVEQLPSGFYRLLGTREIELDFRSAQEIGFPQDVVQAHWLTERLDALTPYLPPLILERIVAAPSGLMIEGEHRPVTVLFANFYGIDNLIQTLGPGRADEITQVLNRHFTAMQDIIRKYGGIVNKVDTYAIGYRIMAVFGAPVAYEDDPARAVRAALEMQAAMDALTGSGGLYASVKQRIGINTGYVFAGNLGATFRQEYSVMGDEVNLAARLMGVADEGQVLISQSTARHVEGLFQWQEREPVNVKGKSRPVRNYHVTRSIAGQAERIAVRGGFFGRRRELDVARALVDAALAGRGAVLDISGDPGVGKSRLIAEISAYAREHGAAILRGESVSYGRGLPYLPWTAVLRALFDFWEGEDPELRRDKLIAGLEAAELSDWAPVVGQVLGVDIAETPLTASLDAQLRQQRFFDVVLQLIQERSRRSPLLLVLEDMQWADAVSLDLVTYVARNVPDSSLLFLIVHRPDLETLPWCTDDGCQALSLTEMTDEDSLELARLVLGGADLSPPLRRLILDRAQGNPLFVEEVTRTLRESGAIELETRERVWVLDEAAAAAEVPTTLASLIMSRIDRLETTDRRVLQVASVMGGAFRTPALARVYPYDDLENTLPGRLDGLVQIDLARFEPPDEYAFKHALTQEVAYESLPFSRRRELHVRVGEDIEQHHTGDLAERYGVLARHFDQGRVWDKAFAYTVKAGDRARDEFANEAALDFYRRVLEIAAEVKAEAKVEAEVLSVLEAMGDVYRLIGRYAEAIERFHQAIAHRTCSARRCSDLLRKIAKAYELQGQYEEALQYLARGRWTLSWDEQDKRSLEMARICNLSGWVYMRRGEMEQAIADCEQGLEILTGLEHNATVLRGEADLNNTLGTVYVGQGNYSRAAGAYQRSTELRERIGDLPGLSSCYNNLALTAWAQGNLGKAGDYLKRSLEISRQIGNNYALAFGYNNLGAVSYKADDVAQALDHYRAALALRQRIGDNFGVAQSNSNIGEAHLALRQYAEARHYLERAAAAFEAIQSEGELPEVYCRLAEVELAQDDVASVLDYAGRAREIAAATGNPEWQGIAERILALGQAQAGQVAQARQSFEASIASLQEAENRIELACSHYELGSLLTTQAGAETQAHHHLEQAVDLFAVAGAEHRAAAARAALAQLDM
jgi:class 3 adenylate cyclase/predicted ATPase